MINPIDITNSQMDDKALHPHQEEAIEAIKKYYQFGKNAAQNGMLVMPTGSGKTFTAVMWLLDSAVANGYKILWLVHRQELVGQADKTFREQSPILARHGIKKLRVIPISGEHYKMSQASRFDVNVCSIGSVASKNGMRYISRLLGSNGKEKLVVVIDEAHHAISPSYTKALKRIAALNPNRILLGLTATPTRMQESDYKRLLNLFNVTDNIKKNIGDKKGYIFEVTLKRLLLDGFLARPVYKRIETEIMGDAEFEITAEDEGFFAKFGELSETIKEQLAKSSRRNDIIVNEYLSNRAKYGKTLIFAVNQLHCKTLHKAFTDAGVNCNYCISGESGAAEVIRDFKANKFDVLINVQILTEGSDVPDIQSVFLTRQTNSDSLLMQMIGRGLRGEAAGGTKCAYIVDFHDTWDKFSFWLDPTALEMFEEVDENAPENIIETPLDEITPEGQLESEQGISIDLWDVYSRMYSVMRSNMLGLSHDDAFPHGWYSVATEDGDDKKVLVYDRQLPGYEAVSENSAEIIANSFNAEDCLVRYFDVDEGLPTVDDIRLVIDMLIENNTMPDYYTFDMRDKVDAREIAAKLRTLDMKLSEMDYWLEDLYEHTPILKELYKVFFVFKKSVYAELNKPETFNNAEIITIDERGDYEIVPDYYNLTVLLDEVIKENVILKPEVRPTIRWTRRPMKSYFGMCRQFEDGRQDILINSLLSSPETPTDVVKYLIFHELLHANGLWKHDEDFRTNEWAYPNSDEHDGFLDSLGIRYNVGDKYFGKRKTEKQI